MSWRIFKSTEAILVTAGLLSLAAGNTCHAERPSGWGGGNPDYELQKDTDVKHGGAASGLLRSTVDMPTQLGTCVQRIQAENYRGRRIRLSGFIKTEAVEGS